jgi:Uma2 family endonuclease
MPLVHTEAELLTVADYLATPEGGRFQLIEGELIMAPAPRLHHQKILWNLSQIFARYLADHPLGEAFFAPCDVYLSEHDVLQPDLFFVAKANLGKLADDGLHGAPDLAVEILSPSSAQLDKKTKRRLYARHGAKELWLVDPFLLQIQIYDFARDSAKPARILEEDETFTTPLLPGLKVKAAEDFKR